MNHSPEVSANGNAPVAAPTPAQTVKAHKAACCGTSTDEHDSPFKLALLTTTCAVTAISAYFAGRFGLAAWSLPLYAVSYLSGGWAPVKELVKSVRAWQLDVNLLMILAAAGAAVIGDFPEGATLLFLFSLSGALEKYTLERTARSISALVELRPETALVLRDGTEQRAAIESIEIGERVRVLPGERLAVDGVVVEGSTSIDQSTITGESIPQQKAPGDPVFAGTLNERGSIVVRVQRAVGETALAKIVHIVREAQDAKPETERMVQRWQKPYVIGVLVGSTAIGLVYLFFPSEHAVSTGQVVWWAVYRAMVLLVAASPCAVVIATPAATLAGITRAARSGVLFKAGAYLEKLSEMSVLAFDKTGTLTVGKPGVASVWAGTNGFRVQGSGSGAQTIRPGTLNPEPGTRLLQLAASVEQRSEHPLAQAVAAEARARGLELLDATDFESHTGNGVHALANGIWIGVGKPELFESHGRHAPQPLLDEYHKVLAAGQTALLVQTSAGEYGVIGVADAVRPEAAGVIRHARRMGIRHVILLTGDHAKVAQNVARAVGADRFSANLLPEQKVMELSRVGRQFGPVAMVGDGVNDAPALAAAELGVAMGGAGTDVALETADIVLMKNDLKGISKALWLSRRTRAAISRGLIFAFSVIGVLVVSSLLNQLPLWLAVLCHEGSTVLTVFSGLYLLVERLPEELKD